jgi:hypothetical protein
MQGMIGSGGGDSNRRPWGHESHGRSMVFLSDWGTLRAKKNGSEDGAKMVAIRVDTKPDEAIP